MRLINLLVLTALGVVVVASIAAAMAWILVDIFFALVTLIA